MPTQHDYNVANGSGAVIRADLNSLAAAIASMNEGDSAPSPTFPNMLWADTLNDVVKKRDSTNTTWVILGSIDAVNLGLLALAGGTMTGELNLADNLLTRAYIKDYALVQAANAAATGSVDVDLVNGNEHHLTLTGNITTLTISNWPATGRRGKLTLYLKQGGAGSFTVAWPGAVDWGDVGAPTLSTAPGDTDVVVLTTDDAGTNIFAMLVGKGFV